MADTDTVSPFCIHPDVETMHNLSEFGYCIVVSHADDKGILEIFCKDTPLCPEDFELNYIYFGQFLFTTTRQDLFAAHVDTITQNIRSSAWDLYTIVHVPVPTTAAT